MPKRTIVASVWQDDDDGWFWMRIVEYDFLAHGHSRAQLIRKVQDLIPGVHVGVIAKGKCKLILPNGYQNGT